MAILTITLRKKKSRDGDILQEPIVTREIAPLLQLFLPSTICCLSYQKISFTQLLTFFENQVFKSTQKYSKIFKNTCNLSLSTEGYIKYVKLMFNMKENEKYFNQLANLNSRNILTFKFARLLIPVTFCLNGTKVFS